MQLLESAQFCMQPRGDGYTRKSTFDSILSGCIPVFFHPVSAYLQYTWHLPRDYRSYSVFIPHRDVVDRNVSIEEVLRKIPPEKVARMRERVIQLIPTVMYRHPAAKGVTFKDAFDVALDRVVDRVAKRRRAAAEGREYVDSVDGADSWKYDLLEDGQTKIDLLFFSRDGKQENVLVDSIQAIRCKFKECHPFTVHLQPPAPPLFPSIEWAEFANVFGHNKEEARIASSRGVSRNLLFMILRL
uniref:Xyloglucan galactosyltransferase KATAMARI1 n=1 Tax=Aegilops tauschii TaxID=37682 RepID=M8CYN8_AEGTA